MLRKLAIVGALSLCALGSAYAAGNFGGLPTVAPATPLTGSELSPADTQLPGGQTPQSEVISTQQYRAAAYGIYTPLTATTITAPATSQLTYVNPAGTIAALTIITPSAPVDGQRWKVYSTKIVTALTLTAATGQTIDVSTAAPTAMTAGSSFVYIYNGATAAWFREG